MSPSQLDVWSENGTLKRKGLCINVCLFWLPCKYFLNLYETKMWYWQVCKFMANKLFLLCIQKLKQSIAHCFNFLQLILSVCVNLRIDWYLSFSAVFNLLFWIIINPICFNFGFIPSVWIAWHYRTGKIAQSWESKSSLPSFRGWWGVSLKLISWHYLITLMFWKLPFFFKGGLF